MNLTIKRPAGKRPFGVSVIVFLIAVYVLFMAGAFFFPLNIKMSSFMLWLLGLEGPFQIAYLIVLIIFLVLALGLWHLQRWAWVFLMVWQGLLMIGDIWGRFNGNPSYLTMILSVIIVFYINQREVKKAFSGRDWLRSKWTT
ncbi:MAG: hypothetical protein LUP94_01825 [Candidatus Methanomethylicus sp.]|nr:hypothetical protein [Candidatus Methanomethylicus sp.]